jgi:hypothetical protein
MVKLTVWLRRHGVDLIGRGHGVIEVLVAAGGALWLQRGARMGHTALAQRPPGD